MHLAQPDPRGQHGASTTPDRATTSRTGQPNFREFFYTTVQLAGESQVFDGNGSFVRFQAGGGPTLTQMANPGGGRQNESLWAHNISAAARHRPRLLGPASSRRSAWTSPATRTPSPTSTARSAARPPDPKAVPVRRAIREHLRDFIAIGVLVVLAIVTTSVILVKQQANFPSWLPILGQSHFELKAEFSSAQAVTPGQGQTVDLSGVKIGSVQGVNLESGRRGRDHEHRPQVRAADPHRRRRCSCARAPACRT